MKGNHIFLFCLILSASISAAEKNDNYAWPLDIAPVVTSTFGEGRGGHIHSGLDFSSGGKTGVPIIAVESGEIIRISYSPWGYGKALYVKLKNGKTAVYGHLDRLTPQLEDLVYKEQLRQGRYRVNLFPQKSRFFKKRHLRVKKGQILGYSGDTGVGYPHLHFEIRTPDNYPLNPMIYGFPVKDIYTPTSKQLLVRPIGDRSLVNADDTCYIWKVKSVKTKTSVLPDTPWVSGTAGLAVNQNDKVNSSIYNVSVYKRSLYVDDSLVFSARFDTLPYEVSHHVMLDRDREYYYRRGISFDKLYREPGSRFPIYTPFKDRDGMIFCNNLTPGLHRVKAVLEDVGKNKLEIKGVLGVGDPPDISCFQVTRFPGRFKMVFSLIRGAFPVKTARIEYRKPGKEWKTAKEIRNAREGKTFLVFFKAPKDSVLYFRLRVRDSLNQPSLWEYTAWSAKPADSLCGKPRLQWKGEALYVEIPVCSVSSEKPSVTLIMQDTISIVPRRLAPDAWRGKLPLKGYPLNTGWLEIRMDGKKEKRMVQPYLLEPEKGGYLLSADSLASADFPANGILKNHIAEMIEQPDLKLKKHSELKQLSRVYSVSPPWMFTNRRIAVTIKIPDSLKQNERIGIFKWNGRKWRFAGRNVNKKEYCLSYESMFLNPFCIMQDTIPPKISNVSVRNNQTLNTAPDGISFHYSDKGAGITSDLDVVTEIDGRIRINQMDPEQRKTTILRTNDLSPGKHTLKIIVKDGLKNKTERTIQFSISG